MTYEDKQKSIREKILKDIELKEQQKKLRAKERYERYKDSFNKQIESELGKEFVSILKRILFD